MMKNRPADSTSEAAVAFVEAEAQAKTLGFLKSQNREEWLAECNRKIGRIQAANMHKQFGDVALFGFLRDAKKTKIYKDLPGIGTWEKFCDFIGLSRRTVDEKLQNYAAFGEKFSATVASFSISEKDLRKLRFAAEEGRITIGADTFQVGDRIIPLDFSHRDDIRGAIETVLDEADRVKSELKSLRRRQDRIVREEIKGLTEERDELLSENQRLKRFDPEGQAAENPDWCVVQMKSVHEACSRFTAMCRRFILDDRMKGDIRLQAEADKFLTEAELSLAGLRRMWADFFMEEGE